MVRVRVVLICGHYYAEIFHRYASRKLHKDHAASEADLLQYPCLSLPGYCADFHPLHITCITHRFDNNRIRFRTMSLHCSDDVRQGSTNPFLPSIFTSISKRGFSTRSSGVSLLPASQRETAKRFSWVLRSTPLSTGTEPPRRNRAGVSHSLQVVWLSSPRQNNKMTRQGGRLLSFVSPLMHTPCSGRNGIPPPGQYLITAYMIGHNYLKKSVFCWQASDSARN